MTTEVAQDSTIVGARERVAQAREHAKSAHAELSNRLVAWYPERAQAIGRWIVESQYRVTSTEPAKAMALREMILGFDWTHADMAAMALPELTLHESPSPSAERLARLRLMFGTPAASQGRSSWLTWLIERHDDALWTLVGDAGYAPGLRGNGSLVNDLPVPSDVVSAAEAFRVATVELVEALQRVDSLTDARSRDMAANIWADALVRKSASS